MTSEEQKAMMKRYLRAVEKQTGMRLKNAYETYNYTPGDYRTDGFRMDGYVNMINNYGTAKDTMEHYHYERELPIMDGELAIIYEGNAIFARIIDAPAEDCIRKGFSLKDVKDDKLIDFYKESLRNLSFEEHATNAIKWQRLFGGAMIVMLINDGRGIDEPVDWDNVESVDEMRVYDRSVIVPDITTMFSYSGHDPFKMRGSKLGQPERYYVASKYGSFWVHESRVLLFKGGRLPERCSNFTYEMWGMPEYLRIKRELRNVQVAHDDGPRFLEKSVQPIYKMKGLQEQLSREGGETDVLKRLDAIDQAKGLLNTMLMDADGEDYSNLQYTYTGVSDIINTTCNMLSAATGIPQTILFGRSPAGQNATGASDLENYYNKIAGMQEGNLRNNIGYLLRLIFQAGINTKKIDEVPKIEIEFEPLWSLSETEQAQLDATKASTQATKASTANTYVQMGVLDPNEVRKALAEEDDFDIDTMLDDIPEEELFANMQQQGGDDPMAAMMGMLGGGQGAPQPTPSQAPAQTPRLTPADTSEDEIEEESENEEPKGMQIGEAEKKLPTIPSSNPTSTELGVASSKNTPLERHEEPSEALNRIRETTQANYQGSEENTAESVLSDIKASYALNNLKEEFKEKNEEGGKSGSEGRAKMISEGQVEGQPILSENMSNNTPHDLANSTGNDSPTQAGLPTSPVDKAEEMLAEIKGKYNRKNEESETDEEDAEAVNPESDNLAAWRELDRIKEAYRRVNEKTFEFPEKTAEEQILDELKENWREELEMEYRKPTVGAAYTHEIDTESKPSCGVIVLHNGKLLTAVRKTDVGRGLICSPGGHLEEGENSLDAAIRETQEEFSITPTVMVKIGRTKLDKENGLRPDIYICTEFDGIPTTRNTDELTKPKYYTMEELEGISGELFTPFRDAVRLYTNWKQGSYHTDAEEDEDEPRDTHHKYHGNTRLPFGLCKEFGIDLPKGAAPKDAWNALRGKGIKPTDVYTELEKTGSTKGIVEKVNGEHPETKNTLEELEKDKVAEKFKDTPAVKFLVENRDKLAEQKKTAGEIVKRPGFTEELPNEATCNLDIWKAVTIKVNRDKDLTDGEKEYLEGLLDSSEQVERYYNFASNYNKIVRKVSEINAPDADSYIDAKKQRILNLIYDIQEHNCIENADINAPEFAEDYNAHLKELRKELNNQVDGLNFEMMYGKGLFNFKPLEKKMGEKAQFDKAVEQMRDSQYGKMHPEYCDRLIKEAKSYEDVFTQIADEMDKIANDESKPLMQRHQETVELGKKIKDKIEELQHKGFGEHDGYSSIYKTQLVGMLSSLEFYCSKGGKVKKMMADAINYADIRTGMFDNPSAQKKIPIQGMSVEFDPSTFTQERLDNAIWCKFTSESISKFKAQAQKAFSKCTAKQRKAVWDYTMSSGFCNRTLTGYVDNWDKANYRGIGNINLTEIKSSNASAADTIENLTTFLNDNELEQDTWVQHGMSKNGLLGMLGMNEFSFEELQERVKRGDVLHQSGFCSCGASKRSGFSSKDIVLNIFCPQGTKGVYVAPGSNYGGKHGYKGEDFSVVGRENEMLLQRDTEFKLMKCEMGANGIVYIDVVVVGQHPLDYDKIDYPGKT